MVNLNKEFEVNKDIEMLLEEMKEREEFHCTGFIGCPANACSIEDSWNLSDLNL